MNKNFWYFVLASSLIYIVIGFYASFYYGNLYYEERKGCQDLQMKYFEEKDSNLRASYEYDTYQCLYYAHAIGKKVFVGLFFGIGGLFSLIWAINSLDKSFSIPKMSISIKSDSSKDGIICPKCGSIVSVENIYCNNCGIKIK